MARKIPKPVGNTQNVFRAILQVVFSAFLKILKNRTVAMGERIGTATQKKSTIGTIEKPTIGTTGEGLIQTEKERAASIKKRWEKVRKQYNLPDDNNRDKTIKNIETTGKSLETRFKELQAELAGTRSTASAFQKENKLQSAQPIEDIDGKLKQFREMVQNDAKLENLNASEPISALPDLGQQPSRSNGPQASTDVTPQQSPIPVLGDQSVLENTDVQQVPDAVLGEIERAGQQQNETGENNTQTTAPTNPQDGPNASIDDTGHKDNNAISIINSDEMVAKVVDEAIQLPNNQQRMLFDLYYALVNDEKQYLSRVIDEPTTLQEENTELQLVKVLSLLEGLPAEEVNRVLEKLTGLTAELQENMDRIELVPALPNSTEELEIEESGQTLESANEFEKATWKRLDEIATEDLMLQLDKLGADPKTYELASKELGKRLFEEPTTKINDGEQIVPKQSGDDILDSKFGENQSVHSFEGFLTPVNEIRVVVMQNDVKPTSPSTANDYKSEIGPLGKGLERIRNKENKEQIAPLREGLKRSRGKGAQQTP
ncbi:hypothetical protein FGM00_11225 [Aggregatimonas sangjinii]|uniref:Uncharacterized protein n=1 Tax=Aggregatimonas sangjinii TaxID=2583587 RepID=A0A5B7SUE1_9FLAO|nr:hypothetical protein [Aggregatimonas sangjinii]QCX00648.1 hypothetical protein FGM00_11225 [Aggregatimonas sangjinii]